uniref:plasmid replication initiator TrfA n=1 Tax=Vibrio cholerae TaxID=666 RepID=UPI002B4C0B17|nr:plasmid replication initiator TrfA [Vibrio cholerae]
MKDLQLSLFDIAPWSDNMRVMPNDYARSALFTVRNKRTPRTALHNHSIYHVNKDVNITYTGVELRAQDDELVWQQVLEYSKRLPLGELITFTFYRLYQDLDWSLNQG